jgi:deazaflavin-dependent oxidoreductase (nitroreductase family)
MSDLERPSAVKLFWRFHRWIYRVSDGRIGSTLFGHKVLRLTTTGRKSGKPRTILIYTFPYGESYVIVGSNLGAERHPAWYLNLQEDPSAEIQVGRKRLKVEARTAVGQERERLWADIIRQEKAFSGYKDQTGRQIPVVILDPLAETSK